MVIHLIQHNLYNWKEWSFLSLLHFQQTDEYVYMYDIHFSCTVPQPAPTAQGMWSRNAAMLFL